MNPPSDKKLRNNELSDKKIIDSWEKNAPPWITAIQYQQIESRRLVTDRAIIDAIKSIPPETLLDIGCGEGWLARELAPLGISVLGLDVIPTLIDSARESGMGRFQLLAYEDISAEALDEKYDAVVCNFSLLGKESVEHIFKTVPKLLNPDGSFIIQTIHPITTAEQAPYVDGWREGSWAGFNGNFCDPAPWYFRTLESWHSLFHSNGFTLHQIKEPINPATGRISSLIMVGRAAI